MAGESARRASRAAPRATSNASATRKTRRSSVLFSASLLSCRLASRFRHTYSAAMDLLPGKTAANRVAGMISAKYQVHGYSVDVTVRNVSPVDPAGQLDFAGSEYTPAGRITIATHRRRPEDRYEWWDLGRGCYFVEFNETLELAEDEIALLEPDERLLRAGASHAPVFLRGR